MRRRSARLLLCVLCVLCGGEFVRAQMLDPKQMSGIPRPVDDLPSGSVSVRVIRGQLSNNIPNQPVELKVGDKTLTVKTDASGRAQFDKLPPSVALKASTDVDGEHLESQEFPAPSQGGIRLLLVATDTSQAAATTPEAPAVAGEVVLAGNSRIILEPADDTVSLYYLLDVQNTARVPVKPSNPFTFDFPAGSTGCGALDGSSPLGVVNGIHVRVDGPFPPGSTFLQVACSVPVTGASLDITQRFPAALERVTVIAKKVGGLRLVSAQLGTQQEMPADGETYIAAMGAGLAAGQPLELSLQDLPHHSPVPRWTALSLALAIALLGIWAAVRAPSDPVERATERKRLVTRRDKLFNDLLRLEREHRAGRADERRYTGRREELVVALEHVYGALDDDTSPGSASP